jgi:uncharacterized protein (TIGR03067 family)
MSEARYPHPDPAQLTRFGLGDLGADEWAEIERHVRDCPACGRTLTGLPDDPFVARLRACGTGGEQPGESMPDGNPAATRTAADGPAAPAPADDVPAWLQGHPRYRLVGLLGAGGMGAVYKAEHRVMGRSVALKVINLGLLDNPTTVERFRREVQGAAQLSHPNIVTAHDAEQAGDSHFLVMEYVEGVSLARLVAEKGPLPMAQACDYVRQAALGLQHAFEKGMVHRDIKPANLMLTPAGQVKVLDFGLARFAFDGTPDPAAPGTPPSGLLTQVGTVMGTPDYIAPEQATDAHAADIRADIYSLGCTLYDLLAGHAPFPEGTAVDKVLAHAQAQPPPLTALRKDVPAALARVVEKMMAKDPARRYQTPTEVAEALAPFITDRGRPRWPAPRPWDAREMLAPYLRRAAARLRRRSTLVAGVLLLALGLLAYRCGPALFLFATNQGELVLTSDDPAVTAAAREEGILVRQRLGGGERRLPLGRLRLPAVDYDLEVTQAGNRLFVGRIRVSRGSQTLLDLLPDPTLVERAKLQGTWVVVGDGTRQPPDDPPPGSHVLFDGDRFRFHTPDGDDISGTYYIDPTANPKQIDLIVTWGDGNGHVLLGIYAIQGDTLKVSLNGDARPTEFAGPSPAQHPFTAVRLAPGEVRRFLRHEGAVKCVAFTPDGRLALSASGFPTADATVRVWDVADGREKLSYRGHKAAAYAVAVSPDGRRALSGGADKAARLWEIDTGKQVQMFRGHTAGIGSVAFAPDGRRVLSGGWDGTVRLWDIASGHELKGFAAHTAVQGVTFSRDGHRALSGGENGVLLLWDVDSGRELRRFTGHSQTVSGVALSPDGLRALSGGDGVRLWDVEGGRELRRFEGVASHVESVAFSPDDRRALAGGSDGAVRLWDVDTGRKLAEFPGPKGSVWSVAFSPDGRFALAGYNDWTVRLWRLPDP